MELKAKANDKMAIFSFLFVCIVLVDISCLFTGIPLLCIFPTLCLISIPLSKIVLKKMYIKKGIEDYWFRKELFSIGIRVLKTEFHNEGVRKHKEIMQKQYEESRKKERV